MASILVTGGAGYIGSHTVIELLGAGHKIIIIDNLNNAEAYILDRIKIITGKDFEFYPVDVTDKTALTAIFSTHPIDAVIHFAAHKSVAESVQQPLRYFHNNLVSLITLLEVMNQYAIQNIVFSSSATVYGDADKLPITEAAPFKKALSAYGSTKQMGEEILEKSAATGLAKAIALRYFNPVGAHASALIGELPKGIPNNLFPYVMQVAAGKLEQLTVYGNNYATPDGTCLRDYIHVTDLAKAHVLSCERLIESKNTSAFEVFNLGTGSGTSVLQIIQNFEKIAGRPLRYSIGKRREGDAPAVYADAAKANTILGWRAMLDIEAMIQSAWKWELERNTI
ncbi:MAG TPA: UDP-glucose 4-epimerase GalE [Ferruginibacter sp.]|nr:UDP-glucose 4-epimerase GalE [Ferruginibacter sp.]HMP22322.1 UDP-glucose 4-epimerase GalE [Ferruginibacter sp.]